MDEPLDNAPCGFLTVADDGAILQVNATLLRWLGYQRCEVVGRHINLLLPAVARIFYQTHIFPLLKLQGELDEIYLILRQASGGTLPVLANVGRREHAGVVANSIVCLPMQQRSQYEEDLLKAKRQAEAAMQASAHANTALQQLRAELEAKQAELLTVNAQLAVLVATDSLTGVLSRRAFEERLPAAIELALRTHAPLSLLLVDVDHFKQINDTLGHPTGDAVLRLIAQNLARNIRASDIIARYGGEEFALILPSADQPYALGVAQRLCRAIAAERVMERVVTVSVGAATLLGSDSEQQQLLNAADRALYIAKARGRNRVVHAAELF